MPTPKSQQPITTNRREFLSRSALAGVGFWVAGGRAEASSDSPNEKLNIAAVGVWDRGNSNVTGVASQNVVALCDVDSDHLDRQASNHPGARKYRDFRRMLEAEAPRIDAVVVSTADHVHAPAAAMALRMGKHVYCEKPLSHSVWESRQLACLAAQNKLATQMGTQIHAEDNYRRVVELIQAGAIGPVRQAHVWCGKSWSDGRFVFGSPAPAKLDWDLWLGPAPQRDYSKNVHPANWRRFWDYGSGTLGDMACHYVDLVHWALELRHPTSVAAEGPEVHPVGTPAWMIVRYEHPARGKRPPVNVTWYDGGKRPEVLSTLKEKDGQPLKWGDGQLFIGDEGMLISDYGRHRLLPEEKFADYQRPEPTIAKSKGHHNEWIEACKTGSPTTCNFDYSGALSEAVLLGTVAFRTGKKLDWDGKNLCATNCPEADQYIRREYRKGWTL